MKCASFASDEGHVLSSCTLTMIDEVLILTADSLIAESE